MKLRCDNVQPYVILDFILQSVITKNIRWERLHFLLKFED